MIARFGIDTSILVRLATGDPEDGFEHCVRKLTALIERDDAEVFASNQVIGEAYVALQHHYGVSKPDARAALASVLKSPLFGLTEEQLFELAWNRKGSLRGSLRAHATDVLFGAINAELDKLAGTARRLSPFGFFADVLGPRQGRKAGRTGVAPRRLLASRP